MRWRTSKSTPHCLAISHTCRASTARKLRGARHAALQLALKLGAGGPGKGFWKTIMLSMTPCSTPSVHSVARKAHAHPLGPVVLEVAGLPQHFHVRLAHQRALMGVLYGHELSPLGIGLNVQPECKLHCEVRLFISRRKNPVR